MQPPERIRNDVAQGQLQLHWADTAIALDHDALREACRCAECHFKRHHGMPIGAAADVRITGIESVGYGVQIVFSDGHARGIFPWAYLALLAEDQKLPKRPIQAAAPLVCPLSAASSSGRVSPLGSASGGRSVAISTKT